MKATMKDVAALAGVGVGTVSRVINGVKVKEATKEKVDAAIKELSYEPNEYARGLKMNKTQTIALIIPTIWHPFFAEFAYHVEQYLAKEHYKVLLCNADGDPKKEAEYIQMVKQNKVDGIIGITYSDIDTYVSSNIPFVSIDRHFSEDINYVTCDNEAGGRLAAKHLLECGVKCPAYIGSYSTFKNETTHRKVGFTSYLKEQGVSYRVLHMSEPVMDLEKTILSFFEEYPEIDGFLGVNDVMAMNVMTILTNKLGKQVPEDIQVMGFDGVKMYMEQQPYLSTIVQPIKEMAKQSVEILLSNVAYKSSSKRVVLPIQLFEGTTTKKQDKNS